MLCAGEALLGWGRHHTSNIPDQGAIRPRRGDGPNVDAGKQGKHVPGHRNYDPTGKSAFAVDDHVELTFQAWVKGEPVEGRKGRRRWEVGQGGRRRR